MSQLEVSKRVERVAKSSIREIFDLAKGRSDIIDLAIGEPNFEVPEFVRNATKSAIDSTSDARCYQDAGLMELRIEVAKKIRKHNAIRCDPSKEIQITYGGTQAIATVMNSILKRGDEVMILTPAFPAYRNATLLAGGVPVEASLDDGGDSYFLNIKRLERCLTARTKLIVINSPCNPTGLVMSSTDIEKVCEFAINHDLYVLSDEVYEKFLYDGAQHFSPASVEEFKRNVITVNSFSKTYAMTGFRLGYLLASEEVLAASREYNRLGLPSVPTFVQNAGIAALRGGFSFFDPVLQAFDRRRTIICDRLEELGFDFVNPNGGFYVFPKIPVFERDSVSFRNKLLTRFGIAVVAGSGFGESGERHFRLSYSRDEETLLAAMNRLAKLAKELNTI